MKRLALFACILAIALPTFAAGSKVKVINASKWDIHHMFVSPAASDKWGPDQLEDNIIQAGATFTINGIPCDEYDIKVVDEDGDECIIEAVRLCSDHYWKITDDELLECEGFGDGE